VDPGFRREDGLGVKVADLTTTLDYRAASASSLLIEPLDALTAVYHRASGITHLLDAPAPEILAALAEPATLDGLLARLGTAFDLADADRDALAARLDELVEAGLVERL
jgi:PqqD family protein of HPr-rel-A system